MEALINSDINEKTNPILIMGANSESRVFEENTLGTNNLTENTGEFRWIHLDFSIWWYIDSYLLIEDMDLSTKIFSIFFIYYVSKDDLRFYWIDSIHELQKLTGSYLVLVLKY